MEKRKGLSKKIRFEVFKRDKFTCQYCGRKSPDVILQVDHIIPVANGGKNDMLNLVTSCVDCNLGKGANELSDDSAVRKQQQQMQNMADKNEQLEMLIEWRKELQQLADKEVDIINSRLKSIANCCASEIGEKKIRGWLKKYDLSLILDAIDISFDKYYDGSDESRGDAFNKIGGICFNKTRKNADQIYFLNYLKKVCDMKFAYVNNNTLAEIVKNYIHDEDDFENIKFLVNSSRNWSTFVDQIWEEFV